MSTGHQANEKQQGSGFLAAWFSFFLIWIAATTSLELARVVAGLIVAGGIALLATRWTDFWAGLDIAPRRFTAGARYLVVFLREMVKSNIAVLGYVYAPRVRTSPDVIHVSTRLVGQRERLALTNTLTLTPGSLVVDLDGKQIGIVINAEASLLSYRKDLFERFKVKVPDTMQELEEAAKFFTGKEVDGKKMVGITLRGKGAAATCQWVDFLYSFGGSWTNAEGKSNLASPESIAAFKFYGDLLRNYGPQGGTMLHWSESTSIFMEGKAAMIFDANVFKSLYENPKESKVAGKVGYTTIPAGPAGKVPHVSNWSLAISGTSTPERQKAAWLFVQWATNKENVLGALMAGVPAGRASAWNSPDYKSKDATPDWTAGSLESFEIGQPQWNPPVLNVPEIRDITGLVIVDAIEGKDVAASAKKAAEEMNKKMEM